ncbi:hypothetical protein M0R45_006451 [Rubus argutus]|uniref:Uncharacterized protein n=1 Tax=Rubus argutus TaxID=59490 RepID=A0AAW1YR49_RUBAR
MIEAATAEHRQGSGGFSGWVPRLGFGGCVTRVVITMVVWLWDCSGGCGGDRESMSLALQQLGEACIELSGRQLQ